LKRTASADLAGFPGLRRTADRGYRFDVRCLNVDAAGNAAEQVFLLHKSWLSEEEETAKRCATACWKARRALLAARPDAGEAEQRAAVEDALLEASAPGALDAWRLLQWAEGDEAPAKSAAELSAPQLDAARTLLAVGRNMWRGLPIFVRRRVKDGKLVLSEGGLRALAERLRGVQRRGRRRRRRAAAAATPPPTAGPAVAAAP
jgi:hypothetical protein